MSRSITAACAVFAFVLSLVLPAARLHAQNVSPDAPIPPGAKGEVLPLTSQVLPLTGEVLPLRATVLELRGFASALAGAAQPLQAALKDLGATVQQRQIKINLSADVLFDFDKATLRAEAKPALEKVAAVLNAYPTASALIEGHTDGKGNDAYNQRLSEQRAESVRLWLNGNGVKTRMTTRGWGKRKPVAANVQANGADDPEGRQKNRRVEITVTTQ